MKSEDVHGALVLITPALLTLGDLIHSGQLLFALCAHPASRCRFFQERQRNSLDGILGRCCNLTHYPLPTDVVALYSVHTFKRHRKTYLLRQTVLA